MAVLTSVALMMVFHTSASFGWLGLSTGTLIIEMSLEVLGLMLGSKGLKEKLQATGKKLICDGGYFGHSQQISTPNLHDSKQVKKFKSCALKRQEKFNGMTKNFDCLSGRFRHSVDQIENWF
jgi:hypothetical protein